MNDVVGFGTAKRLKKAGFPQPEKRIGQIWYGDRLNGAFRNYCPFFIGKMLNSYRCLDGQRIVFENHIFAPAATDILKELGRSWNLFFDNSKSRPHSWVCFSEGMQKPNMFQDANPAEACAAAWLSIHEKTTNKEIVLHVNSEGAEMAMKTNKWNDDDGADHDELEKKLLPFLATLHNHGKALLFSSTSERTENDAAWGHINMKDQSEWVRLFASFGWELKSAMRNPNNWTKLFIYTEGKYSLEFKIETATQ